MNPILTAVGALLGILFLVFATWVVRQKLTRKVNAWMERQETQPDDPHVADARDPTD